MATPHDSLFKAAFQHPENAAALVCCNISSSLRECFDWSTMRLVAGSFIDEELRQRHTDLLFEVATTFGDVFVYLLFEHRSENDARLPLRVYRYEDRIWSRFERDHPRGPLPPILPVIICHAKEGWTSPRSFHELFPADFLARAPELARCVPGFELIVDDLRRTSDDELGSRALAAFAKVVLWLLRDGRRGRRLVESMPAWVGLLEGLPLASLKAIVKYLTGTTNDPVIWEEFRANLHTQAPGAEKDVMTLAEQWFQEGEAKGEAKGRAEGEAKGRAEGEAKVLGKLLTLRFGELPEHYRVRLENASIPELDAWAERVLFANSLAQVFDSAQPA